MKDITVHVRLERYIREWLTFHLGSPVRFPDKSYENEILHNYLRKPPRDAAPDFGDDESVPIVIPDDKFHKPEFYNYLGRHGRRALASAIDALFRLQLWSECAPLLQSKQELNRGIDAWCAANGISLDAREAVRQKFYRLRKLYAEKGIVVYKIYRKKRSNERAQNVHGEAPRQY